MSTVTEMAAHVGEGNELGINPATKLRIYDRNLILISSNRCARNFSLIHNNGILKTYLKQRW